MPSHAVTGTEIRLDDLITEVRGLRTDFGKFHDAVLELMTRPILASATDITTATDTVTATVVAADRVEVSLTEPINPISPASTKVKGNNDTNKRRH